MLLYYINGHGFGHATRSIAVLNEVWRLRPGLAVRIRTSAPAFLFHRSCRGAFELDAGDVDPGTLQPDPLRLDLRASIEARRTFQQSLARRVDSERQRLRADRVALVAGDIPPLAFEVAEALGAPSVALGNFSWDWIYEPFVETDARAAPLVAAMRRSYGKAKLLLRMPLHGDMPAFPVVVDIPHVVRPVASSREEVRAALALQAERRPVVLVTFGGFAAVRFAAAGEGDPGPYRFVTFGDAVPGLPADTVRLPVDHPHRHEDLVAAADAVITKPGYGTVAECLAARTPILFTDRDDFREYAVLVEGMRRGARARHLPRGDLLALRWRDHLEALLADDTPWEPVRTDGAAVAARQLLELGRF